MGLYEQLLDLSSSEKLEGSIADLIQIQLDKSLSLERKPREHYFLKDLCNPIQYYWSIKRKDIRISREIANKMALGNRLQRRAFFWMRKIPDYVCEETNLDGHYVGIDRVVGRYDMRWGNSIVEFKTKPEAVPDVEAVLSKYPNDLEQLCFYAAMSPLQMKHHFLVFQLDHTPFDLTVFKVEIGNIGDIKTIITQRRDRLDTALENSNPSLLGKCRYLETGCDFNTRGICECRSVDELPLEVLLKSVSISMASEKTKELTAFRAKIGPNNETFRPWDLLRPRQCYLETVFGVLPQYEPREPEEVAYKDSLGKAISRTTILRVKRSEFDSANKKTFDFPIQRTWRWSAIHDPQTKGDHRKIVPVVSKVFKGSTVKPGLIDAYKIELTIACAVSSSTQGIAIVIHPKSNDVIRAHKISFDSDELKKARQALRDSIASMEKAIESREIEMLDICPEWIRKKCHSCPETCIRIAETPFELKSENNYLAAR